MQHPQLQKHEGLTPRMQLLYIVPSYVRHTNVVTFEMGLLQSKYFQCTSGKILHKTVKKFLFRLKNFFGTYKQREHCILHRFH